MKARHQKTAGTRKVFDPLRGVQAEIQRGLEASLKKRGQLGEYKEEAARLLKNFQCKGRQ
jgi:hypothetical protein